MSELIDNILSTDLMKMICKDLSKEEAEDLISWMEDNIEPIDIIRKSIKDLSSTDDGFNKLNEAFEYVFSEEGIEEWRGKN
jgi:hypothetical protein